MSSMRAYACSLLSYCVIVLYLLFHFIIVTAIKVTGRDKKEWDHNSTKNKEYFLGVTGTTSKHGYSTTEHTVQTEDGCLLTLFQLQRPGNDAKGPPVLLMHGLLQSASMWIDAGPGVALAYLLADAGYDVWLGNDRGSHYSRRHAWLNPDTDSQYWQFSVTEIGRYDLPAVFDYILSQTHTQTLSYIGFSQGGASFFIMCSERPEYRSKVNVIIGLAPVSRILNTKSIVLNNLFKFFKNNENVLYRYGIWEVLPHGGLVQLFSKAFCGLSHRATKICEGFMTILDASNPGSKTDSSIRATFQGFPAGTSVHNMARYGQSLQSEYFQKFDYGPAQNLVRYGMENPPIFNLSSVSVPTVIIYGKNDGLISIKDIEWLVGKLPNVLEVFEVADPHWTHMDVSMSKNIPKFLFPKIEGYLKKF